MNQLVEACTVEVQGIVDPSDIDRGNHVEISSRH